VPVDPTLDQVAVADLAAGLPVREFRSYKGCRHYSGWYWSATMGQLVAYESRLELARIILADFDPRVLAIAAQPFRRVGPDGSRIRRHVPDLLLVDVDDAVTVVDVKSPHKRTGRVGAGVNGLDRPDSGAKGLGPRGLVRGTSLFADQRFGWCLGRSRLNSGRRPPFNRYPLPGAGAQDPLHRRLLSAGDPHGRDKSALPSALLRGRRAGGGSLRPPRRTRHRRGRDRRARAGSSGP
jgi:hypothetical protein